MKCLNLTCFIKIRGSKSISAKTGPQRHQLGTVCLLSLAPLMERWGLTASWQRAVLCPSNSLTSLGTLSVNNSMEFHPLPPL